MFVNNVAEYDVSADGRKLLYRTPGSAGGPNVALHRTLHPFTREGQWAVEGEGVGADIEVENFPRDVIAGRNPQLERAVEEAMKLLKATPVDRMTTEPAPPTWGKRPPPR